MVSEKAMERGCFGTIRRIFVTHLRDENGRESNFKIELCNEKLKF